MHVDLNDRIYVDYLMAEMGAAELRAVFAGDIQLGARISVPQLTIQPRAFNQGIRP